MNVFILTAVGALILVILVLVFRIHTLIGVMRGVKTDKIGSANKINAAIFPVFFFVGLILFYWSYQSAKPYFLPDAVTVHGKVTDQIFWDVMLILLIAFLVTNVLLYVFPYLYQHKEGKKAYFYPDNHKLEMIWTIIPAVVMAFLVFFGLIEWNKIFTFPEESKCEVIEIMGKQFAWQVRYPGSDNKLGKYKFKEIDATNEFGIDFSDKASFDDFIPRELHVPKGKPVLLRIRARDVIHSVFMPHFRVKMDAVPGMPTKFWFIPTKTTSEMRADLGNPKFNYELACTEICGRGHFAMRMVIVVDDSVDYEAWKKKQNPWATENADYVRTKVPGYKAPGEEVAAPVVVDSVAAVTVVDSAATTLSIVDAIKAGTATLEVTTKSGKLTSTTLESVKSISAFLSENKAVKLEIKGTSSQAIVDALVKSGVSKKRLVAVKKAVSNATSVEIKKI